MKNRKKMIIGIIIAIIVIIITLVTLYFTTDIFKTNKQLFYKYISKVNDNPNSFLQMYTEK